MMSKKAFTLIELLVVTTILSVTMIILYTSFRLGLSAYSRTEEIVSGRRESEVFLIQLDRELKRSVPYTQSKDREKNQFIGKGNSLQFPAVIQHFTPKGVEEGFYIVKYQVKGRTLVRSETKLRKKTFKEKSSKQEVLFQKVKECRFEYLYLSRSGQLTWGSEWLNNPYVGLPRGVRIVLKGEAFGENERTFEFLIPQGVLIKKFT